MAEQAQQDIEAEAIAWHLRLRAGNAGDWEAFVAWLEGDPARSDTYDAVALADVELTPDVFNESMPTAANDDRPFAGPRRWAIAFAAVAAVLLVVLLVTPWFGPGSSRYEVATAAGERRSVPIGQGSSAELKGGTRLILDRDDSRFAELVAGEAVFTVRHDDTHPFAVIAGNHRLEDAGTRFSVTIDRGALSVGVTEGAVIYDPAAARVRLAAGETLQVGSDGRIARGRSEPKAGIGRRRGQLSYTATPLAAVALDLARAQGVQIEVDPRVAALPFTGSIRVDGDAGASVASLAASVGLETRRIGKAWRIEPHASAPR